MPEIVTWEEDGEFALGLNYDRITALLVEAVKEQQRQMESDKAELNALRASDAAKTTQIAELESRLQRLEQQIAAMDNDN